jgi:hypothetical protein
MTSILTSMGLVFLGVVIGYVIGFMVGCNI